MVVFKKTTLISFFKQPKIQQLIKPIICINK